MTMMTRMKMNNARVLSKHQPRKETTEYTVFFDHNGFSYRLDWELADSAEVEEQFIASLMRDQIEADLADEERVREISTTPAGTGTKYDEYLAEGWTARSDIIIN